MAGAPVNRKRGNSPTPDSRPAKRQFIVDSSKAPSSPEEGELEDGEEEQREQQQDQAHGRKFQTKVPFPFKSVSTSSVVAENSNNSSIGNARSTLSRSPSSPPPQQAMKHRLPAKPLVSNLSPRRGVDRYVPPYRDEKEWERGHHGRHEYYHPRREYDSWRPEYENEPSRANNAHRRISRSRSRSRGPRQSRSPSQPRPLYSTSPQPSRPPPPELSPPPIPPPANQPLSKRDSVKFSIPKSHIQPPPTPAPPPPPSIPKSLERSSSTTELKPLSSAAPAFPKTPSAPPPPSRPKKPRRPLIQRTDSADMKAYGRTFTGCGKIDDYDVATKVGEGTFGEVHKAVHRSTSTQVALKRILMHNEKEGMPITAIREIKILKKLNHPNIVQLKEVIVQRSSIGATSFHMVFPYMDHDLAGLLENERVQLTPSQIKLYMKQLLEGTAYMHANNIIHRDMKAANLLISNTGLLQIADFGLARPFDPQAALIAPRNGEPSAVAPRYTNCVVTRWYRPPELFLGARRYGGEIDMWGIGCVLGEIFIRRPILMGSSDANQLDLIWQLCGSPSGETWPDYDSLPGLDGVKRWNRYDRQIKTKFHAIGAETVDLLDKLLILDPSRRITAVEALDHDWFWSDPMPADPKTLPKYESSHEIDKRSKRHIPGPIPGPGMAPGPPVGAAGAGGPGGPGYPPPHHNLPPPMYNPHTASHNSNAPVPQHQPPHGHGHNLPPPLASYSGPGGHHPTGTGPSSGPLPPYGAPRPGPIPYPPPGPHYPHPPPHGYPPPPPNWRPSANWFGPHPPTHPHPHPNQPYMMGVPPAPVGPPPGPGGMGMPYPPYAQQHQHHGQYHGQQHHGQRRQHNHNHHNRNNSYNNGNSNFSNSKPSIWPPPGTHGLPPKPNVGLPPFPDSGRGGGGGGGNRQDRSQDRDRRRDGRDNSGLDVGPGPDGFRAGGPPGNDSASMSALPYD